MAGSSQAEGFSTSGRADLLSVAENRTHQVTGTCSCATLPGRSRRSGRIAALDRGEWGQSAAEGGDVADAQVAEASAAIARLVKS